MLLFSTNLLLLFCFTLTSTKGEVNLEIIKNEDGIKNSVLSSYIEARKGRNFSLQCNVVDMKSGKSLNDQIVVWKKKTLKFVKEQEKLEILENTTIISPVMTFIPILIENQGLYECTSLNYKLQKLIILKVKRSQEEMLTKRRRKRFSEKGGHDLSSSPININSNNLDEFREANDKRKTVEDRKFNQLDVKKIRLHGKNETRTNPIRYHDGTTEIFRIGLGVSFALLAMLGFYRIYKCWRTGTLGPINNNNRITRASSQTAPTNNCQDIIGCDSNQTTITTTASGFVSNVENSDYPIPKQWIVLDSNNQKNDDFFTQSEICKN